MLRTKVVFFSFDLKEKKQGNSPGVNGCLVDPNHVLLMNLLPKTVHPRLSVTCQPATGFMEAKLVEPLLVTPSFALEASLFHDPPRKP